MGSSSRDHPRVCGEHVGDAAEYMSNAGSSPRMRGTPHLCHDAASVRGIIPAYAGNTYVHYNFNAGLWDHPRVCGEHFAQLITGNNYKGSSPRMRGTPRLSLGSHLRLGIIPAYAGNTRLFRTDDGYWWDHPRVCGEHMAHGTDSRLHPGSSPRMRGTPSLGASLD